MAGRRKGRGSLDADPANWQMCEGCDGHGCSYCAGRGEIRKGRAQPFKKGEKARLSSGAFVNKPMELPERYHVILPLDLSGVELADHLDTLRQYTIDVFDRLIDEERVMVSSHMAGIARVMARLDNTAVKLRRGTGLQPQKMKGLTEDDLYELKGGYAHRLTGLMTQMRLVRERTADLALIEDGKKGEKVAYWVTGVKDVLGAFEYTAKLWGRIIQYEQDQADSPRRREYQETIEGLSREP